MKLVVGISGGVDSSVAALLLKRAGHDVTGLFMKNWEEDDTAEHCSATEDLAAARAACDVIGIPLRTVNFATEYWDYVFAYFLDEHRAGRTPNPDVLCNKEIKFKAFLNHALVLGAEKIATGHYARVEERDGDFRLLKGLDPGKDQSYFLHAIGQHELSKALFPVGELPKPEVRRLAQEAGLPNHDRKDSTGICFIGERDFKSFLARYLPGERGELRSVEGETKGMHDGAIYYTIGQRQGLGIGGPGEPWYVVGKDMERNIVHVAQGDNHPALYSRGLVAADLHWVSGSPPRTLRLSAKTRYRQSDQLCTITSLTNTEVRVEFDDPQRAVTPGQWVVFYDGENCLGGGVIQHAFSDTNPITVARTG
jgi:tRNA-specific 2-thiouridylase